MGVKRLFKLIPDSYRRRGLTVVLMVPVTALLNMVGVALLFSMVFLILDGGRAFGASLFPTMMQKCGFVDKESFAVLVVSVMVLVILVKSVVTLAIRIFQSKFLMSLYRYYSFRLFSSLCAKGLLFIRNSNTSKLAFDVNNACYNFAVGYLGSVLVMCGDFVFTILMLITLCFYDVRSLLIIAGAFIPVTVIHVYIVKRKLKEFGKKEFHLRREQMKLVQETFKGYAEMKVNDAFRFMQEKFEAGLEDISGYRVKSNIILNIPPRIYEIAIAAVLFMLILMNLDADNPGQRVFLGAFAVAVARMLPVVLAFVNNWSIIKNNEYTLDLLSDIQDELSAETRPTNVGVSSESLFFSDRIKVENLRFSYPERKLFEGLTFEVRKGEKFGIRGRTGAGKSTIFNILLGLIRPDGGSVMIDGKPLDGEMIEKWQSIVGYVSQDVFISDGSITDNIALGSKKEEVDMAKIEEVVERSCLKPFIDTLPDGVNTLIGEGGCRVSGGQRQRIGIARALYKGAQVLFFDEATSSLDVRTEEEINREIWDMSFRDGDLTVIVISHRPSSLEKCDRILEL